ncbi:toprim domain-containing protein [Dyadobacter sp. CY347]|uniref:toprim domain-containing protein n=1 Tax=Dyadobacter sp. CY347 TaxID=2909336 RepID=UPI001F279794|nr:toprim domain-containing protein [Dyadobacter sp. CY347]MCF2487731.1 toprim domain-containing protein [Dyadobacter sp. CY347]
MRERTRGNDGLLTLVQIKELDIVDYLLELGFEPDKIRNVDHLYLSPFRMSGLLHSRSIETLIDGTIMAWGAAGTISILQYSFQCTVREIVNLFSDHLSFHKPRPRPVPRMLHVTKSLLEILSTGTLSSESLVRYISSRCVFDDIAKRYCRQVNYRIGDRRNFALGLQNDSGGYELRNSFTKLASTSKDITTIDIGASTVSVFEGMFDFLSYKTIMTQTVEVPENHIVLNSISLFERSRSFLERHSQINLYLDRDTAGLKCSSAAKAISEKYNDASGIYDGFKDLNDWLVSIT